MNPPGMAAEKGLCGREVSVQTQVVRVPTSQVSIFQGSHRKRSEGN